MRILFFIVAFSILVLYFPYFLCLLSGRAQVFENLIQYQLVQIVQGKRNSLLTGILPAAIGGLLLEIIYFYSVWLVIGQPLYRMLTVMFALFELYHLGQLSVRFISLLRGKIDSAGLIAWKIERASSLFFFTHALLGILLMIWP